MNVPTVTLLRCTVCQRERVDKKTALSFFSLKKTTQEVNMKPKYIFETDVCIDCIHGERFKNETESLETLIQQEIL